MKISVFLGSPRAEGNTAALVDRVRRKLTTDGHKVETIHLAPLHIAPCLECFTCQRDKSQPSCVQEDDMAGLLQRVMESDVTILACPVFCWSFPAQMKPFLDRTVCLHKFSADGGDEISLVANKKWALIVTAGGDEFDGADLVVDAFRRIVEYHEMKDLGHLVVANFQSTEMLDAPHIQASIDGFCQKLQ
jgi:multimeric flavodoxin WrbA